MNVWFILCLFYVMVVGLAILNHTLTPRMKAAHVAIESMRGHLDAVYDITVAYEGTMDASGQRRSAPSMPGMHPLVLFCSMPLNSFLYLP